MRRIWGAFAVSMGRPARDRSAPVVLTCRAPGAGLFWPYFGRLERGMYVTARTQRHSGIGMQERDERLPADVAVRVFHGDKSYRAHVANVSTGGARLTGVGRLPPEAQLTLLYLHLCVRARVAWSDDTDTGVRFLAPLTPGDLQVLQDAAAFSLSRAARDPEG